MSRGRVIRHAALLGVVVIGTLCVAACGKRGAAGSAPQATEAVDAAPSAVAQVAAPTVNLAGLVIGIPHLGGVSGRVVMEGAIGKAEVALYEYELRTNTPGRQVGMALSEPNGDFAIKYLLQEPTAFLKLEARNIEYRSPNDSVVRRVAALSSIINGLPARADVRVVVSPFTNVVFERFRYLVRSGADAQIAYLSAVGETLEAGKGTGWALVRSPMVIEEARQESSTRSFALAWEEIIRFERLSSSSFYAGMADDYADGTWNGANGDGQKVAVESDGRGRLAVSEQFFAGELRPALERYEFCQRPDLRRDDPQRVAFRCATPAATPPATSR